MAQNYRHFNSSVEDPVHDGGLAHASQQRNGEPVPLVHRELDGIVAGGPSSAEEPGELPEGLAALVDLLALPAFREARVLPESGW